MKVGDAVIDAVISYRKLHGSLPGAVVLDLGHFLRLCAEVGAFVKRYYGVEVKWSMPKQEKTWNGGL